MLYFIGLGLHDVKDISVKGLSIVKKADLIYAEFYTSTSSTKQEIEEFFGKEIKILDRNKVETEFDNVIDQAKDKTVVFLTAGDPMVATTHADLVMQARKKSVDVKIIHSSSIYSAIGETGLQIYKFGKSVSIPFDEEITSFYNRIKENKEIDAHTLVLLDLDPVNNKYVNASQALSRLVKLGFSDQEHVVVIADLGGESVIEYGVVKDLINKNYKGLQVLVIPGKLHFKEQEALEMNSNG
ncbi:MAG: diphthine synthase [Asgard group archaeon]|nr:diphthine synthase [Asgard group archaeon]